MIIKSIRDNCDGKGPQTVEIEVPDPTPEEIAARKAAREARLAARQSAPK
jgi:hypothetical protein